MNLELDEHQAKLAIYAFEQFAFNRCSQAVEFKERGLHAEAGELFSLASKLRLAIGWPEIGHVVNQGPVMKANL